MTTSDTEAFSTVTFPFPGEQKLSLKHWTSRPNCSLIRCVRTTKNMIKSRAAETHHRRFKFIYSALLLKTSRTSQASTRGSGVTSKATQRNHLYLHSSPFSPLFLPGNLLLAFLSLFPLSVPVLVMIVFVFEEARVVPRAAGGELGDFVPSHFEDQLQGLLYVLFKKRKEARLKEGLSGQDPQRGVTAGPRHGENAPGGAGHALGAPRSTC